MYFVGIISEESTIFTNYCVITIIMMEMYCSVMGTAWLKWHW